VSKLIVGCSILYISYVLGTFVIDGKKLPPLTA